MDNQRSITLEPANVGDLLTEVVRVSLVGSLPSSIVRRVIEGVSKYYIPNDDFSPAEHIILGKFRLELEQVYGKMRAEEEYHFSM